MAGRPSKTDQELMAMKDFWLEVRTMESAYNGAFSMFIIATQRPGVFSFRMIFTRLLNGAESDYVPAAIEFVYPNAEQSMLSTMLWRKAISLGRILDQWQLDDRPRRNSGS